MQICDICVAIFASCAILLTLQESATNCLEVPSEKVSISRSWFTSSHYLSLRSMMIDQVKSEIPKSPFQTPCLYLLVFKLSKPINFCTHWDRSYFLVSKGTQLFSYALCCLQASIAAREPREDTHWMQKKKIRSFPQCGLRTLRNLPKEDL